MPARLGAGGWRCVQMAAHPPRKPETNRKGNHISPRYILERKTAQVPLCRPRCAFG